MEFVNLEKMLKGGGDRSKVVDVILRFTFLKDRNHFDYALVLGWIWLGHASFKASRSPSLCVWSRHERLSGTSRNSSGEKS